MTNCIEIIFDSKYTNDGTGIHSFIDHDAPHGENLYAVWVWSWRDNNWQTDGWFLTSIYKDN